MSTIGNGYSYGRLGPDPRFDPPPKPAQPSQSDPMIHDLPLQPSRAEDIRSAQAQVLQTSGTVINEECPISLETQSEIKERGGEVAYIVNNDGRRFFFDADLLNDHFESQKQKKLPLTNPSTNEEIEPSSVQWSTAPQQGRQEHAQAPEADAWFAGSPSNDLSYIDWDASVKPETSSMLKTVGDFFYSLYLWVTR